MISRLKIPSLNYVFISISFLEDNIMYFYSCYIQNSLFHHVIIVTTTSENPLNLNLI